MGKSWRIPGVQSIAVGVIAIFGIGAYLAPPVAAQIVLDGSVGPAGVLDGANIDIPDSVGARVGDNLFHSFLDFNIAPGQAVFFSGADSIANILARVTGTAASQIHGRLGTTISGAGFYFINPNGIHFGPGSSLEVLGDVHIGAAHSIRLSDGTHYAANPESSARLTAAQPAAFGLLESTRGNISIEGTELTLLPGRAFSLIGPALHIGSENPAIIRSLAGRLYLITAGGTEQIALLQSDNEGPRGGEISFGPDSAVDISNAPNQPPIGVLRLRTGRLHVNNAIIVAGNGSDTDSDGGIDINAADISLRNGAQIASVAFGDGSSSDILIRTNTLTAREGAGAVLNSQASGGTGRLAVEAKQVIIDGGIISAGVLSGTGDAGSLFFVVDRLLLTNNGVLTTFTNAVGDAGDVVIIADSVTIDGRSDIAIAEESTLISADSTEEASGSSGRVFLRTDELNLLGRAQIGAAALKSGRGGLIQIETGSLVLDGGGNLSVIVTLAGGEATAGRISITAEDMVLRNGGVISSGTAGAGDAGNLDISARTLTVEGASNDVATGIDVGVAEEGSGNGAILSINISDQLTLRSGGSIRSNTEGAGDAGAIFIEADRVDLVGDREEVSPTGIFAETTEASDGQSGVIGLSANSLTVQRGARISSSSQNDKSGSLILIQADAVAINGDGANTRTGIFSDSLAGAGGGGVVFIQGGRLRLQNQGQISTTTLGPGNAGGIALEVGDIVIDGRRDSDVGATNFDTGIISGASAASSGNGGIIEIEADSILVANRGVITARALGQGAGGSIDIEVSNQFRAIGGRVATATAQSDGGNITLNAIRLLELANGSITTSVSGGGGSGGNISIDPQFVVLNQSAIQANAVGGNGGNIQISAGTLMASPDSIIEASSSLGIDGEISVDAPDDNVSEGLVVLDAGLLDAGRQLTQKCDVAGSRARFASSSRGGLPPAPLSAQSIMLSKQPDSIGTIPTPPRHIATLRQIAQLTCR